MEGLTPALAAVATACSCRGVKQYLEFLVVKSAKTSREFDIVAAEVNGWLIRQTGYNV